MLQVDLFSQRLPEEISLRHRRLRTHLHLVEKCRILALMCQVPAIPTTAFPAQNPTLHGFEDCSRRTMYPSRARLSSHKLRLHSKEPFMNRQLQPVTRTRARILTPRPASPDSAQRWRTVTGTSAISAEQSGVLNALNVKTRPPRSSLRCRSDNF
jgi:hypothetical protein